MAAAKPLLPKPKKRPGGPGRPPRHRRQVVNAILYVNKTGCQWRMLPKESGHWNTLYCYFNRWSKTGLWARVMERLRKRERRRQGRNEEPSAGCVDSQSVKTASQRGPQGYEGGKQVKGRKRHLLVDTLGLMVAVVGDRAGLKALLKSYCAKDVKRLRKLWVDASYAGEPLRCWVHGLKRTHKLSLEAVEKAPGGFQVVKRRWVVERTLAWLGNFRRHSKDYEVHTRNSEATIQISMMSLLIRRLA